MSRDIILQKKQQSDHKEVLATIIQFNVVKQLWLWFVKYFPWKT